ncbi:docking protein 2 isoform X2 [Brachyhypopomus gauderio]|uniref:docking protein 2 isoform X2 n=1 Tax=Brachyhypopomus gauderio TaxID=698409 RepID=UPI0040410425
MEEDIKKRGLIYLQQQRFGKKWRRVWTTLYQESTCSISRLEFFESKDGSIGTLDKSKCKQENKKMNWAERTPPRQRTDEATVSDNTLYCGTQAAMKDFKVAMRRTDAAERCNLRGYYLLRTDFDSLLLKEPKSGEVLFTWPYRYLRRFGRDKMTFSFEAGRRCDSGEGSFEFDTKQGNAIFQYIEAAINLQRAGLSQRQASSGGHEQDPVSHSSKIPPPTEDSTIYSMLTEGAKKYRPDQIPPHHSRLETPAEKHLTGVKSLNLDTRPIPRKNQVKIFRSCPLTEDAYSRATAPVPNREFPAEQEEPCQPLCPSSKSDDTEYSLPFDNIAKTIMVDILAASHAHSPSVVEPCSSIEKKVNEESSEPLYDSIDESAIRSPFSHEHKRHPGSYTTFEHIYDEPEGCALTPSGPTSLYDDPEEVKGDAWKTLGAVIDPSGHEYPYNAQSDDYAVPKPARRALNPEQERGIEADSSPYDNVIMKMKASNKTE